MAKATVSFVIDNDGNYVTDTNGIKGKKCENLETLFKTLGEVTTKKTSEYYEGEMPTDVQITNTGGE